MTRLFAMLSLSACALATIPSHAPAQAAPAPVVTLTRLDCGTNGPLTDASGMSDAYAFSGVKVQLTYSCYLVRHGDQYLLWDAGNPVATNPVSPKTSLVDLLAQLQVKPEQVSYIVVSHYHGDHTGQVSQFPKSTLLIGRGDWAVISDPTAPPIVNASRFASWISGGSKVEQLGGDKDVFGDGSVVVLNTPGHTPGHRSLLVRLAQTGNVLITGDLAHFHENYDANGMPTFNTDRAATLASLDRFKQIAKNLKATVIIQHDQRDVGKLPAFPASAR